MITIYRKDGIKMPGYRSISEFGIDVGCMPKGKLDSICDVPGVKVGHSTIDTNVNKTGVTVILPSEKNSFVYKLPAASVVINGFGKTLGTIQIDELGLLETPIALTNTLNVGLIHDALVDYMIERCELEGVALSSVNPVVAECNDSHLNNIIRKAVTREHFREAAGSASKIFLQGDIGAGKGMVCHGLKGGIGSASRVIKYGNLQYHLGVLVLTNHGRLENLRINGNSVGRKIAEQITGNEQDKGSCIIIMATDLPLDSRQIKRVLRRSSVGLARLGSYIGNGSGEVAIGFSTANSLVWDIGKPIETIERFNEACIDDVFVAMAESTEEAVLRSMLNSEATIGYSGEKVHSLKEFL